jgi:hypothetical protein
MIPVVNSVGERLEENAPEVLINGAVNLSMLLDMRKMGVKHSQEPIAQS